MNLSETYISRPEESLFNRNRTDSQDSGVLITEEDEFRNLEDKNYDISKDAELFLNSIKRLKNHFSNENLLKDNLSLKQICKNLTGQINKKNDEDSKVNGEKNMLKNVTIKESNKENLLDGRKCRKQEDKKQNENSKESRNRIKCLKDVDRLLSNLENRTITLPLKLTEKSILIFNFNRTKEEELAEFIKELDSVKDFLILKNEQLQYLNNVRSLICANGKLNVLIELKDEQQINLTIKKLNEMNQELNVMKLINKQTKNDVTKNEERKTKSNQIESARKQRSYTFSNSNQLKLNKLNYRQLFKRHSLTDNLTTSAFVQTNSSNKINSSNLIRQAYGPTLNCNGFKLEARLRKVNG